MVSFCVRSLFVIPRVLRFSSYLMAIVGNLVFLYVVILNTINILGILNIL